MNLKCKEISIMDLCNVERAVSGKTYKAGSCYIKLSAVDESVGQITEDEEIESRFAVFEPKEQMNTDYLYIAIQRRFPEFLRRYRTTINLQFDTLKHFFLYWHQDEETQEYIVSAIAAVDNEIALVEKQIEDERELKRWYLNKMMR
jgi:restriction endonuclease S subunit